METTRAWWTLAATTAIATVMVGCGGSARYAPSSPVASRGGEEPSFDQSPEATTAGAAPAAEARAADAPPGKPGLATQWGEDRFSRISSVHFERSDDDSPFGVARLFYNDAEGSRAMASGSGFRRTASGTFSIAGGALELGLRDEDGRFFSGFTAESRDFVVGEAGQRYTIVVRNRTNARFECVLSVDGLDVLDGKTASFRKRGYIVAGHGELEVEGFRQSTDSVAAFRFGSVRDSYAAQKHGDVRNVGVIGLAAFPERGFDPFPWSRAEVRQRNDANPFPGQFASPP